jgi:hypothetical protein
MGVGLGKRVEVGIGVMVFVGVAVFVEVGVAVLVGVGVKVLVGVCVGVEVLVGRGRGVFVGPLGGGLPPHGGNPGSPQVGPGVFVHCAPVAGSTQVGDCACADPDWKNSIATNMNRVIKRINNLNFESLKFIGFASSNLEKTIIRNTTINVEFACSIRHKRSKVLDCLPMKLECI